MRFQGGVGRGAERKILQNAIFRGKRHDNKILKVKILSSRNFVVMAQAPRIHLGRRFGYFLFFFAREGGMGESEAPGGGGGGSFFY